MNLARTCDVPASEIAAVRKFDSALAKAAATLILQV
jgi:hypothetical protein